MQGEPEKKFINEQSVFEALKKVGAIKGCPRCDGDSFKIMPGFFAHSVQTSTKGVQIGGQVVPTWVVICATCGFVSQHAAEVLTDVNQIEEMKH
jgi:hypothetical protein